MIGLRPDPLAGLSRAARLRREQEDAEYLREHVKIKYTLPEAINRKDNTWVGTTAFVAADFRPYRKGMKISVVVCSRVDLDHPIYFPDNRFTTCADCGCDIQHRPNAPDVGDKICLCCAARRHREYVAEKPKHRARKKTA
jgi:hypothetical protein